MHCVDLLNLIIQANVVRGLKKGSAVQLGYPKGRTFRGNIIQGGDGNVGLCVWGNSGYNKQPGENVISSDNQITAVKKAISLNGGKNVMIQGNIPNAPKLFSATRAECVEMDINEPSKKSK